MIALVSVVLEIAPSAAPPWLLTHIPQIAYGTSVALTALIIFFAAARRSAEMSIDEYRSVAFYSLLFIGALMLISFGFRVVSTTLRGGIDALSLSFLGVAALIVLIPFVRALQFNKEGVKAEIDPVLRRAHDIARVTESLNIREGISETNQRVGEDVGDLADAAATSNNTEDLRSVAVAALERDSALKKQLETNEDALRVTSSDDQYLFIAIAEEVRKRILKLAYAAGIVVRERSRTSSLIRDLYSQEILTHDEMESLLNIIELRNRQAHVQKVDPEAAAVGRREAPALLRALDRLVPSARFAYCRRKFIERAQRAGLSVEETTPGDGAGDFLIHGAVTADVKVVVGNFGSRLSSAALIQQVATAGRLTLVLVVPVNVEKYEAQTDAIFPVAWFLNGLFRGNEAARSQFPWLFVDHGR